MTLKEMQEKYKIKRINFDEVQKSGYSEEYGYDALVCPYCGHEFDFESEDIDEILGGTTYRCYECKKNFFVKGEREIKCYCKPMEDAVLENRRYIEADYKHMDECAEKGCTWQSPFGTVEWEVFREYARPLFENMEKEENDD